MAPQVTLEGSLVKSTFVIRETSNHPALCGSCQSPYLRGYNQPSICRVCFRLNLLENDEEANKRFRLQMKALYDADPDLTVRKAVIGLYTCHSIFQTSPPSDAPPISEPQAQISMTEGGYRDRSRYRDRSALFAAATQGFRVPSNEAARALEQNPETSNPKPSTQNTLIDFQQDFNKPLALEGPVHHSTRPYGASSDLSRTLLSQPFATYNMEQRFAHPPSNVSFQTSCGLSSGLAAERVRMRGQEARPGTQADYQQLQLPQGGYTRQQQGGPTLAARQAASSQPWAPVQQLEGAHQRPEAADLNWREDDGWNNHLEQGMMDPRSQLHHPYHPQAVTAPLPTQPALPAQQFSIHHDPSIPIDPRLQASVQSQSINLSPTNAFFPCIVQPFPAVHQNVGLQTRQVSDRSINNIVATRNRATGGEGVNGRESQQQPIAEESLMLLMEQDCMNLASSTLEEDDDLFRMIDHQFGQTR